MDKWGQLPYGEEPADGKSPWTVRPVFLALIPMAVIIVFLRCFIIQA